MQENRFAEFRAAYPKRAGGHGWVRAASLAAQLVSDGTSTWDALITAAQRYATYCRVVGSENTQYVLQARTFLGPQAFWDEEWNLPVEANRPLTDDQKREQTIMRQANQEGLNRMPNESLDNFSDRVRKAYLARIAPKAELPRAPTGSINVTSILKRVQA